MVVLQGHIKKPPAVLLVLHVRLIPRQLNSVPMFLIASVTMDIFTMARIVLSVQREHTKQKSVMTQMIVYLALLCRQIPTRRVAVRVRQIVYVT